MNSSTNAVKCWWYIMPIAFITYSLMYLDRVNFSFASVAGVNEDLGITKGISSLLGALFLLGYFFFQIPGAIYVERRSVRKLISVCLILWGACASLTGMVSNIPMPVAIRPILGVVEAAVMPATLIYISNWFTKSECSRADTFPILGNSVTVLWISVMSGYLIQALGWREIFVIEGFPTIIWTFCWWVLAKDKPSQVGWLSESEKVALQAQLEKEQQGIKAVCNYSEAFRSCNVILPCMQYFAWSIGAYGFVLWLLSIIHNGGANLGMVEVGWLSSVPYLAVVAATILVSWASDKPQNCKSFVWPLLLIATFALIGSWAVGADHLWISYALLVIAGAAMYAPYGSSFAIIPEMLPRNIVGGVMVLINSMGALGSFFGSWSVDYLNGATGSPSASYIFTGVVLFVSVRLTLIVKPTNNQQPPTDARHA